MPMGETTGPGASSQSGRAAGAASQMQDQAREAGSRVVGAARQRARSLFETQQHRAADQIEGVAQALHQAAQQLDEQNQGLSPYVTRAADQVERLADTVRNRSLDDIIDQTERFARRQPELFVGGAMLLGLALGRFLRASSDRRYAGLEYDISDDEETAYYGGGYGTGGGLDEAGRRLQTRTSRVDDGPGSTARRPRQTGGTGLPGGAGQTGGFAQGSSGAGDESAASLTAMGAADTTGAGIGATTAKPPKSGTGGTAGVGASTGEPKGPATP